VNRTSEEVMDMIEQAVEDFSVEAMSEYRHQL
jgi:hypothetical protein